MNSSLNGYWSSWPLPIFYRQWFWAAEITQNAWSVTVEWRGCFLSLFIWSCSTIITIIMFNVSGSFDYQSAGIMGCKLWLRGSRRAKRKSNDPVFLQELVRAMYLKASPWTEAQTRNWRILPTAACAPPRLLCALTLSTAQRKEISSKGSIIKDPGPGSMLLRGSKSLSWQLKGRGSADILKTWRES